MRSRIVASILSMLATMAQSFPAHADYPWMFAQMVCAPTLGYFSIRRITIMNLPHKGPYLTEGLEPGPGIAEALRRSSLIFDSEGLKTEPLTCSIPDFTPPAGWGTKRTGFNIKVIGHHDHSSEESSYCRMADNVEVFLNGKSIGLITLNPCANGGETPLIIEVAHNGVELAINKCVEPSIFEDPASNKIVCSETPFAGDAR